MTYVEFYAQTSVENICSILTNVPKRVVIVGEDEGKIQQHITYYKMVAKQVRDAEKNKVYNDVLNGVLIDWDGKLHEADSNICETENAIDVLLMHGMVPVFVSCKNGAVTKDELFKLNTVAEKFGGIYSKKILVATSLDKLGKGRQTFEQRATDMGITILSDVQKMPDHVLADEVRKLWEDR